MQSNPLIILTGPTSVGKTKLSISLAKKLNGEIISADSMQVYKRMNIGTAKASEAEQAEIRHHLIDILEPWEDFNVVSFQEYAKKAVNDIQSRGKIPIVVGGTGFYIQSLLYDINFTENDVNTELRKRLEAESQKDDGISLYNYLLQIDPVAAEQIHPNNKKRVIRAVEFYELTGEKISDHNAEQKQHASAYNSAYFVLTMNRETLYNRIDQRVDIMLQEGLLNEVKSLLAEGCTPEMVSMQGLGYKEIIRHLQGEITLEEAIYNLKRDTRHFAKRQLTWFRRERDVIWLDKDRFALTGINADEAIEAYMIEYLQEHGIVPKIK